MTDERSERSVPSASSLASHPAVGPSDAECQNETPEASRGMGGDSAHRTGRKGDGRRREFRSQSEEGEGSRRSLSAVVVRSTAQMFLVRTPPHSMRGGAGTWVRGPAGRTPPEGREQPRPAGGSSDAGLQGILRNDDSTISFPICSLQCIVRRQFVRVSATPTSARVGQRRGSRRGSLAQPSNHPFQRGLLNLLCPHTPELPFGPRRTQPARHPLVIRPPPSAADIARALP